MQNSLHEVEEDLVVAAADGALVAAGVVAAEEDLGEVLAEEDLVGAAAGVVVSNDFCC